jgi:1-acyl-sn-glycerol-3-phosphate acyltransferase
MELVDHLWHVAGLGRITVAVEFHAPVTLAQFGSRKALSEHCQRAVAEGVAIALAGRRDAAEKAAAAASAKKYT